MISLTQLIREAYTAKIVQQLIQKFQQEQPSLTPEIIQAYISRFDQIKNSPNVQQKDIFQYNWKDFETIVDANQKRKVKAGKIDPTAKDANLIYKENGIRVYRGQNKKACIKYGTGYSFCISARGDDNMYDSYRYDSKGTPYFVFNDNMSSEQNEDGMFIEPKHLLVIFIHHGQVNSRTRNQNVSESFSVSDADNEGEQYFDTFNGIKHTYPWVAPLQQLIVKTKPDEDETKLFQNKKIYWDNVDKIITPLTREFHWSTNKNPFAATTFDFLRRIPELIQLINGEKQLYSMVYTIPEEEETDEDAWESMSVEPLIKSDKSDLESNIDQFIKSVGEQIDKPEEAIRSKIEVKNITKGVLDLCKDYSDQISELVELYKVYKHKEQILTQK